MLLPLPQCCTAAQDIQHQDGVHSARIGGRICKGLLFPHFGLWHPSPSKVSLSFVNSSIFLPKALRSCGVESCFLPAPLPYLLPHVWVHTQRCAAQPGAAQTEQGWAAERRVPWGAGGQPGLTPPAFLQAHVAVKPKGRKVPEETCDEVAALSKFFSANDSQKHYQSFMSFKSTGQLSVCRNLRPLSVSSFQVLFPQSCLLSPGIQEAGETLKCLCLLLWSPHLENPEESLQPAVPQGTVGNI